MSKNDVKSNILDMARKLDRRELTHFEMKHALKGYSQQNKKIHDLVQQNVLEPMQRGIYRWVGRDLEVPPSGEILAQLLHGPSYLSLEWALAHYSLIPERVNVYTSVTIKRKKTVHTPAGVFEYQHLNRIKYSIGYKAERIGHNSYLLATPLKALVDLIYFRVGKKSSLKDPEIQDLLRDDYRIDVKNLLSMIDRKELSAFRIKYKRVPAVDTILAWLERRTARSR